MWGKFSTNLDSHQITQNTSAPIDHLCRENKALYIIHVHILNEHGDLCNDVIVTCNVGSIQHFYIEQHEEGGKIQI